jgi:hypothetical protein
MSRDEYDAERRRMASERGVDSIVSEEVAAALAAGVRIVALVHRKIIKGIFLPATKTPQAQLLVRREHSNGTWFRRRCWWIGDYSFVIWKSGHWHYNHTTYTGPGGEVSHTVAIGCDEKGVFSRGNAQPTVETVHAIEGVLARYMARNNIPYPS